MTRTIHQLRAEVDRRQWQPIETAPKDGRQILVIVKNDEWCEVVMWDHAPKTKDYNWRTCSRSSFHATMFSFWQPIPEPPDIQGDAP